MGRQIQESKNVDLSYIAGFLDGDGSVMFQLKKRKDIPGKRRIMFTICFYQDTRHEKPLLWIKKVIGIGYISRRNDGITELRINGYEKVETILKSLLPYLKFKKKQVDYILSALNILRKKKINQLSRSEKRQIANAFIKARKQSYQSGKKTEEKMKEDVCSIMNL
ncbi:MAG: LAGLIDADG family homing endonuclease [Patescibacteria group bacterium]